MAIPGSTILEGAPYGAQPVSLYVGPIGGPYNPLGALYQGLLGSAPRTASTSSGDTAFIGYRGCYILWNVTVNPGGAQTLSLVVEGKDQDSGAYFPLLTIAPSATPAGPALIYPGASGAAVEGVPVTRNLVLPLIFRVRVVHSAAGAWTYTVSVIWLP